MITLNPYGHAHITKPGYGEPEPLKPVHTCDPPETMAICLDCPLTMCMMDTVACPLYGQRPGARRRLRPEERAERDEKIRDMVLAGWRNVDIQKELHISKDAMADTKRRLRERGEIT